MPPGAFLLQARNALKNKEIGKTPEPSVRKRIEGKNLAEFFGQKNETGKRMVGCRKAYRKPCSHHMIIITLDQ
jgi:hypothetical protein